MDNSSQNVAQPSPRDRDDDCLQPRSSDNSSLLPFSPRRQSDHKETYRSANTRSGPSSRSNGTRRGSTADIYLTEELRRFEHKDGLSITPKSESILRYVNNASLQGQKTQYDKAAANPAESWRSLHSAALSGSKKYLLYTDAAHLVVDSAKSTLVQ
jgi:hypothetical protein